MLKFALLLAIEFSVGGLGAFAACTPIPGADQIWSNKRVHWVFIGEVHGSNEAPSAFIDLVCDSFAHDKNVTVAVERPMSEQGALTGVLSAKDLSIAEMTLLDQPGWKSGMDGRASKAMLKLLLSLRVLRAAHPGLNIFAFETPYKLGDRPGKRDEAMGQALLTFGKSRPNDLILILTGNVHAMQSSMFGYDPAAMFIPPTERLSLEVTDTGGESWADSNGGCGPSTGGAEERGRSHPRGIYLDPHLAPYGKVDGILALGVPLTASEPADGDPDPLPECRKRFLSGHPADFEK
ncbi:MAG: hypothetical protein WBF45_19555 [Acidobacteriaceae bacterium]